ncbi:MAG: D-alanyl-D-alanine carboxypeptidase/D-alanyl-D-alanine-endopeptidase [Bacteroidetes bacterium]|nr:D-alanyl-D-alanine carboxypeptidase/D-alanyl-D-alanine-endopeptidase [Bacteroidota bacterium]
MRKIIIFLFLFSYLGAHSQSASFESFLADSVMTTSIVSFLVADADSGNIVFSWNPEISLIPASTMKLITSSAALELLGPGYTFSTTVGYSGTISRSGRLDGNIIIRGGGDPSLGSEYFSDHYGDFTKAWGAEIKKTGIRKIRGKVIADDSYFDYEPVAPRWLWEDIGVYYGAGVYGLSVFDNSCRIIVKSSPDSSHVEILGIEPGLFNYPLTNRLKASGSKENWYVYMTPYSSGGWLSGTIPVSNDSLVLDASIPDPPLLIAGILNNKIESEGIKIRFEPSTARLEPGSITNKFTAITETVSPLLSFITDVLNKESVNLYAEHLVKELGRQYRGKGTTIDGLYVIKDFISGAGIDTTGLFFEDGSGLSARNGINAESLVKLLLYMKNKGKYFSEFYSSLPDAGINGTLSKYFSDPVFESNLKAKSGSMTRVRCYAGYFTTSSGKQMAFSILVNNFQGSSGYIISYIEEILKEIIINE